MAKVPLFVVDFLPAHRKVEAEVEYAADGASIVGARFRGAYEDDSYAWPWTRAFSPNEYPVRLKWAYLTVGDEMSLVVPPR